MTTVTTKDTAWLSQQPRFGTGILHLVLLVLVGLFAGVFEALLFLTLSRVPLAVHFPVAARLLYFVHLVPLLAGLSCWRAVGRGESKGIMNQAAASLCYGVIAALLSAAYVALGCMELAFVLPSIVNR
jgi:hypothetical protein